jgi:hypothetical protein
MIRKAGRKIRRLLRKEDTSPIRKGDNKDYIFIHINKTGGTSIAKAIGLPSKRHLTVKEVISIIGEDEFNKAFVFTVVRNPWDKVVSHYEYRVKTNQTKMADRHISFKQWVKQTYGKERNPLYYNNPLMFAPQSDWLKDREGVIRVAHIIKFESLAEDFREIAKTLGIHADLHHLNWTKREPYKNYYDSETIQIVSDWFEEDIRRFGYRFDDAGS